MTYFRTTVFWLHLLSGVTAGLVILIMSGTGALLALKPQIQDWIDRDVRYVRAQDSPRLSAHQLLAAVKGAKPEASPQSLALARNPTAAATINLGPEGNVYVDPYTGAILGTGSVRTARFFESMTSWHRYMGATGEYRATGRSATGVSNLAFLVLAVTGLYIWWPKQFTVKQLKSIVWFRQTSTGRARDFNWHNTIGFWCLIPIVIMTVSGAVISYPWASDLVYRLTGSPVPSTRAAGQGVAVAAPENRNGTATATAAEPLSDRGAAGRGPNNGPRGPEGNQQASAVVPAELDRIWAHAERQVPTWSLLSMRLPNRQNGLVSFTITDGANWNPFARSTLTLNAISGDVIQWQPYEENSIGQKLRGWLRFAHTGELGGLTGQIIAGVGCLGGVFLVCTGLSLAFRRLWHWPLWNRLRSPNLRMPGVPFATPASPSAREAVKTAMGCDPTQHISAGVSRPTSR